MTNLVQEEFGFGPVRRRRSKKAGFLGEWKLVPVRSTAHESNEAVTSPEAVVRYWHLHVQLGPAFNPEVECVVVIALNCKRWPKGHQVMSVGTINEAIVHPREVFRAAIVASAYSIVLAHNHPSGDPTPSQADLRFTRRIRQAAEIIQIQFEDHVIIGGGKHFSFRDSGYLL